VVLTLRVWGGGSGKRVGVRLTSFWMEGNSSGLSFWKYIGRY
jgi:hypothetical protein